MSSLKPLSQTSVQMIANIVRSEKRWTFKDVPLLRTRPPREHRLYQTDFLLRKYGFKSSDFVFDDTGNLSLTTDPKEAWAKSHPEFFPVNVNRAAKFELLRVPGLGPITVNRILKRRRHTSLRRIEDIDKVGARILKAQKFLIFS